MSPLARRLGALLIVIALLVPAESEARIALPTLVQRSPLSAAFAWLTSWLQQDTSQLAPAEGTERPPTFDDIGGYHEAKAALKDVISAFAEPERLQKLGVRPPRGVLLVGPPGTGKTLLARALATEANVNFIRADGPNFNDMWSGAGQVRLRQLFAQARKMTPVIIFIDEIDAIGAKRSTGSSTAASRNDDHLLNQLLVELDGFSAHSGMVVVGATNRPDILDPALTRSGRFDRRVVIGLPDVEARRKILQLKLSEIDLADDVDFEMLSDLTAGLSGADIANWVSIAAMHALRDERDYVNASDFERGSSELLFGVNEKVAASEEALWQTCVHEAGHALVGSLSQNPRRCVRIVIDARGSVAGFVQWSSDDKQDLNNREFLASQLAMSLGGLAAERLLLGNFGAGGSSDLAQATLLAENMVLGEGMGEGSGMISLVDAAPGNWREEAQGEAYADIRRLLQRAEADADALLTSHRALVEQVAVRLKKDGKLSGQELRKMIEDFHSES